MLGPCTYVALSPSPEPLCITVSPGGGLCNWADTRTRTDTHPQPCRWRLNLGSKRPLRPAVLLVPEAGAARAE